MGNVPVSTSDTEIYYPSDWLIEGGPPFNVMACPKLHEQFGDDVEPLQVIYNTKTRYFGVVHNEHIVMESKDPEVMANYVKQYAVAFKLWVDEQDDINAEAEAAANGKT